MFHSKTLSNIKQIEKKINMSYFSLSQGQLTVFHLKTKISKNNQIMKNRLIISMFLDQKRAPIFIPFSLKPGLQFLLFQEKIGNFIFY